MGKNNFFMGSQDEQNDDDDGFYLPDDKRERSDDSMDPYLFFDNFFFVREVGYAGDGERYIKKLSVHQIPEEDSKTRLRAILGSFFAFLENQDFATQELIREIWDLIYITQDASTSEERGEEIFSLEEELEFKKFITKLSKATTDSMYRKLYRLYKQSQ